MPRGHEHLAQLLAPVVGAAGLDLEEVVVTPAGRRRLVRVVVDRDGGVTLDDVALVSSRVSAALDEADDRGDGLGGAPYVLEVTSPGVDRPLTSPRHWRRARGRLVRARLADGGEVTGRVTTVERDGVRLDVDGADRSYGWQELGPGRVQVEFGRPDGSDIGPDRPDDGGTDGDGAGEE